jgi:glycosyltransferase involved in cell wall biosynthesis
MPRVSIVVTTKNEEKNIDNCLRSIQSQTFKDIDIILVDNHSTDKTKEIAKSYTDLVFDKGPERSAQRNYGIMEISKSEFAMYVDADMILSSELIEGCIGEFDKNKNLLKSLYIHEIILGNKFFSKVRRFERNFYDSTVIDGSRFFLRSAFLECGGFDESMSGPEDWDLDKKIKKLGEIGYLKPEGNRYCIYHNESEFHLSTYLKKKSYYSGSFNSYIDKWGKNDPDIIKQFGILYRYLIVFVEKGKWINLLKRLDLTIGMYFLRFLVGIVFLFRKKQDTESSD